jgi:hypothetical protein
MKRSLLLLSAALLFGSLSWADSIPTYFNLGPQSMGYVSVSTAAAVGGMAVCQVPSYSCAPSYHFTVATAPGLIESHTTSTGDGVYTTYQSGSYGTGGTIDISVEGTSFLSGYLVSAIAMTTTTSFEGTNLEFWEKSMYGIFKAVVLNSDYWGNTDPESVGGSFSIVVGFPHSPYATGAGHLEVTPIPEPDSLLLLVGGLGAVGRFRFKKSCRIVV